MDPKSTKELILVSAVLLWSVILFFAIASLAPNIVDHPLIALPLIFAGTIWLSLTAIGMVVVKNTTTKSALNIGSAVAVILAGLFDIGAIGGGILLALSLSAAQRRFTAEADNRIHFRVAQVFPLGIRLLVVGLIVAVAGLSLPIVRQYIDREGLAVDEKQIEFATKPLEPLLNNIAPGIRPSLTMDDLIDQEIQRQQANLPEGYVIPPDQKEVLRKQLGETFGQDLSGQETYSQIIASRLNSVLQRVVESNTLIVSIVIILLAFLALRAIIPILTWIVVGLIAVLLYVARKLDILHIEETQGIIRRLEL